MKVVNVGRTQLKTKVVERLLGFDVEVNVDESNCHFLSLRSAHAPLPAAAHVEHVVEVVIKINYRNKEVGRG